jgi:hypothetical protein
MEESKRNFEATQPAGEGGSKPRTRARWRTAVVVACLTLAAYWYGSPYWVMRQMRAAVIAGDADAVSEHVDFQALRESFKAQFMAKMAPALEDASTNAFASLGAALGMSMATQMIDNLVTPSALMAAIRQDQLRPRDEGAAARRDRITWEYQRTGFDKIVATPVDPDTKMVGTIQFVFRRRGFADWKLVEMKTPAS